MTSKAEKDEISYSSTISMCARSEQWLQALEVIGKEMALAKGHPFNGE